MAAVLQRHNCTAPVAVSCTDTSSIVNDRLNAGIDYFSTSVNRRFQDCIVISMRFVDCVEIGLNKFDLLTNQKKNIVCTALRGA